VQIIQQLIFVRLRLPADGTRIAATLPILDRCAKPCPLFNSSLADMTFRLNNYFQRRENFRLNIRDAFSFIVLAVIVWAMNSIAQMLFPSQNLLPYFARATISAAGALILIFVSIRLFKKSNVAADALGLKLSQDSLFNFILGVMIGMIVMVILGLVLYIFVPYHFIGGSLKTSEAVKEAHSFFWGNFTEELLFRGYPLIILSQLLGWRVAVCIMALPFGLFHLPGLGFNIEGLKMVITTSTYSFVFSYAFILTGTIWTAIGVHVVSNILLHSISGLDGLARAVFTPVFETTWPVNYDPGLLSLETSAIVMALLLYLLINKYQTLQRRQNSEFQ
jgi:membrane protease YdiL (CAAX protease family)